jgi:hypothetical protein
MTKLSAAFQSFGNALQKAGIFIKMNAAAKPSEVFLHLKREFKNKFNSDRENTVISASITNFYCAALQLMGVNIVATDTI